METAERERAHSVLGSREPVGCYINSELIPEAPPSYIDGLLYPFLPTALPSYDNIFSVPVNLRKISTVNSLKHIARNPSINLASRRPGTTITVISNCASNHSVTGDDESHDLHTVESVTSYRFHLSNDEED